MLKKVVFLDRDGTINRDSVDYIKSWLEFEFLPRSIDAICHLTAAGFTNIVITNQSAIPRKLITPGELDNIHSKMKAAIQSQGGKISDIFFCPHLPGDGCDCRKPLSGLITRARQKYDIELAESVMIGDSARDIMCAHDAGCGYSVLVKTGNYAEARSRLAADNLQVDYVASDLYAAADWVKNLQF